MSRKRSSSVSRRQFLAASAAVPVGAVLPGVAIGRLSPDESLPIPVQAEVITSPPSDSVTIYVVSWRDPDETAEDDHQLVFTPDRKAALKAMRRYRQEQKKGERKTILSRITAEFPDGRSYRAVQLTWSSWIEEQQWYPRHALDLPKRLSDYDGDSRHCEVGELLTRDEALAEVMRQNIIEYDAYETVQTPAWWAIMQVGKPIRREFWGAEFHCEFGFGLETVDFNRPVRVCWPTEQEIARFNPPRYSWKPPETKESAAVS